MAPTDYRQGSGPIDLSGCPCCGSSSTASKPCGCCPNSPNNWLATLPAGYTQQAGPPGFCSGDSNYCVGLSGRVLLATRGTIFSSGGCNVISTIADGCGWIFGEESWTCNPNIYQMRTRFSMSITNRADLQAGCAVCAVLEIYRSVPTPNLLKFMRWQKSFDPGDFDCSGTNTIPFDALGASNQEVWCGFPAAGDLTIEAN